MLISSIVSKISSFYEKMWALNFKFRKFKIAYPYQKGLKKWTCGKIVSTPQNRVFFIRENKKYPWNQFFSNFEFFTVKLFVSRPLFWFFPRPGYFFGNFPLWGRKFVWKLNVSVKKPWKSNIWKFSLTVFLLHQHS